MKFIINDKEYDSVPFTYNTVCDMEDLGVSIDDYQEKTMSFVRAYLTICMRIRGNKEFAGNEIGIHIINGGTLEEVIEVAIQELNNSDFFRSLVEKKKKKAPANATTKKTTTKKAITSIEKA